MPISAAEHRLIVKAIASGDADAAGRAMFEHVMDSKARTIEHDLRQRSRTQVAQTPALPATKAKSASKTTRSTRAQG